MQLLLQFLSSKFRENKLYGFWLVWWIVRGSDTFPYDPSCVPRCVQKVIHSHKYPDVLWGLACYPIHKAFPENPGWKKSCCLLQNSSNLLISFQFHDYLLSILLGARDRERCWGHKTDSKTGTGPPRTGGLVHGLLPVMSANYRHKVWKVH